MFCLNPILIYDQGKLTPGDYTAPIEAGEWQPYPQTPIKNPTGANYDTQIVTRLVKARYDYRLN